MRNTGRYGAVERREAAEWLVRLREMAQASDEDLHAWERWFAASEGNRSAFKAVSHTYEQAGLAAQTLALVPAKDDYDPAMTVAEWRAGADRRRRSGRAVSAAAAVLALAALGLWLAYPGLLSSGGITAGVFVTGTGEHRELRLSDGSRIVLGARSRLSVRLSATARALRLESGEAFFTVQREAGRPFAVQAGQGRITALGTAFDVRATGDRVTVAVAEGVVGISDGPDAPQRERLKLRSGEQLAFTAGSALPSSGSAAVVAIRAEEAARWREGWLIYRKEPLRYVVEDVARYSRLKLKIDPSVAGELSFTGAISKNDVAEWILALPEIFPVIVQSDGTRMTILPRGAVPAALPQAGRSSS